MGVINIFSVVCMVYFQIYNVINTQRCDNINGSKTCCSGYQWNDEKCIPCAKGYIGKHCEKLCAAPFYGFDCQSECNCTKEDCHHADGCKQTKQTSSQTTSTYVKETAEGNVKIQNKEDKPSCLSIYKTASTDQTSMVVGIIVLEALAFIISLTILFTYQIEKRQRLRNCREGNV